MEGLRLNGSQTHSIHLYCLNNWQNAAYLQHFLGSVIIFPTTVFNLIQLSRWVQCCWPHQYTAISNSVWQLYWMPDILFHLAECKWSVSFFSNTLPETDELNAHLVAYRCCACRVWEGQESAINQVFFVLRVGLNTYIILQAVLFLPCYKVHKCGRMFSELAGK